MSKYHMLKDQKILYVEDEKDIREELVDLLSLKAKEVIEATNGQEGFDLYVKHKPDMLKVINTGDAFFQKKSQQGFFLL